MVASRQDWIAGLLFIVGCVAAGALVGVATGSQPDGWYRSLQKPAFTPPGWVFGPVWTVLYASMGVAAWLVWTRRNTTGATAALVLFGVQLALNLGWSVVFFSWHQPGWAFLEITVLWAAIGATVWAFLRVRPIAGWLMVPYLTWVTFAAILNATIWRMNA